MLLNCIYFSSCTLYNGKLLYKDASNSILFAPPFKHILANSEGIVKGMGITIDPWVIRSNDMAFKIIGYIISL